MTEARHVQSAAVGMVVALGELFAKLHDDDLDHAVEAAHDEIRDLVSGVDSSLDADEIAARAVSAALHYSAGLA